MVRWKDTSGYKKNCRTSTDEPIARDVGATLAQLSIAWCLQNPHVSTVLTGASRVSQVHENMRALEFVDAFTPEVMAAIDAALGKGAQRLT